MKIQILQRLGCSLPLHICCMTLFAQTNPIISEPAPKDIVINEILYRPKTNAPNYIEYYNNSRKTFDLSKLSIANRNSSGAISSVKSLNKTTRYLSPGDHIVVTSDSAGLTQNYKVKNPGQILVISSMPSLPNTSGYALLLNSKGDVIDEVNYNSNWQYRLINSDIGVALERIDPSGPSQNASNWHSAAASAGYGTPTYINSQHKTFANNNATITIVPAVFSPDNDGKDDIASIQYQVDETGYIANVTIFNPAGRPVRYLVKNGIIGLKGYWNWDGFDEKGTLLSAGPYIILTELFTLQGQRKQFKNVLVLANALK